MNIEKEYELEQKKPNPLQEYTKSQKFKRGTISTAFTIGFLVIVVLINVIVSILGERFPSINLDMTKNSTNSLSSQTLDIINNVKIPVTINILASESAVKGDQVYAGTGLQYSQVGTLVAKVAEKNPNIKVEYIDLARTPTFASKYKTESLQEGDVLVVSDKRHRLLTSTDLFDMQYSQDGGSTLSYSKVDSALASGLSSVTAEHMPVVAFDTGHKEIMDPTTFKSLLSSNNFETKDFNLLTENIPDKAQMIVLGCPTTDYTDEEIKKLEGFLGSTELAGDRTLMVTFHPSQVEMPKLSTFLKEWGIEVPPQTVIIESDQSKHFTNDASYIISDLQSNLDLGSKTNYTYFTTPQSNPVNTLFDTQGNRKTFVLAKSDETCYLQSAKSSAGEAAEKKSFNTAVLTQESIKAKDKAYKANVVALGSAMMFNQEVLMASTFSNGTYLVDLSRYATGTSNAAAAVNAAPVQVNVADITLNSFTSMILGFGIFTILIPLLIAIAGIVVFNKRRHL